MREMLQLIARALAVLIVVGAVWPWAVPFYSQGVAGLADRFFVSLRQPFGAQATSEGIQLSWQPLRYTNFSQLQEQMGYVDRFARQGLQGHRLLTVDALYLQAGVIVVLALVVACPGLAVAQKLRRTALALGVMACWQALDLLVSAHIEFQLRLRTLNTAGALLVLDDPGWYIYYGVRSLPVTLSYLWPWLIGGGVTYRFWRQALARRSSEVTYEATGA